MSLRAKARRSRRAGSGSGGRAGLATLLTCAALCFSAVGHAETDADRAAAEALFTQGRALMDSGNYSEACEKLRTSNALDPAVGTLLYLGDCFEKGNRLASAWMTFEEARAMAEKAADSRSKIAAVRAAALKPRLVYVVVVVPSKAPPGLEVRANGRVVPTAAWGQEQPVDEGELTVMASAPGFQSVEVKLDVLPGAKEPYRAVLPELVSSAPVPPPKDPTPGAKNDKAPPPAAPQDSDPGAGQRTAAYIVGGVGVAAAILSGVFTGLAASNNSKSLDNCDPDDPNACSVLGSSQRDDALNQASIATVAGIVGAVGLAAGVTLYVTAPSSDISTGRFQIGFQGAF